MYYVNHYSAVYSSRTDVVFKKDETVYHYYLKDFSLLTSAWNPQHNMYFGKDGKALTGWANIDGQTYHFTPDGFNFEMAKGIKKIDDKSYYFNDETGALYKDQFIIRSNQANGSLEFYFAGKDGVLAQGYQTIDGLNYYFDPDGRQLKGAGYDTAGKLVVTDKDTGIIQNSEKAKGHFVQDANHHWKYITDQGEFAVGHATIDGHKTYFDQDGNQYRDKVLREFVQGNATITYFDENGHTVSNRFAFDKDYPTNINRISHQTGWLYIGADGTAVKGDQIINGVLYHFDKKYGGQYKDTIYHQQEQGLDGSLPGFYYLDSNGRSVKNAFIPIHFTIDDHDYLIFYHTDQNGQLAEGWQTIDGKTYYFAKLDDTGSHRVRFGQIKGEMLIIDGAKYYFDPNSGELLRNQTVTVDGKDYTLGQDGKVQENYGFITKEDGQTYYQLENGEYAKGLTVIDHKNYYFDKETGQMVRDKIIVDKDNLLYGVKGSRYYNSYYFGKDGYGVSGLQTIDGKLYYFGANGASVSSNVSHALSYDDDYYYVSKDEIIKDQLVTYGLFTFGYNPYYENTVGYYGPDGKLLQGWYKKDGQTYYTIEPENAMSFAYRLAYTRAKGLNLIDGEVYLFDTETGQMKSNGFYQSYDNWYYLNADGVAVTGWQTIDGKVYYFSPGRLGEDTSERKKYTLMTTRGVQVKGKLVEINHSKYYFDPNSGELWTNRTLEYEGHTYQLDDKGKARLIH